MEPEIARWFESSQACCANHPARSAEVACRRCGSFQCELCVDRVEPSCCEPCAALVTQGRLPSVVRGVAWKLLLAPGFAVISAALLAAKHVAPPTLLLIWLVPVACTALLLLTRKAIFGWLGVLLSVGVLGSQGLTAIDDHSWRMLSDVVMLAIAPLAASAGCLRLSRDQRRVELLVASA